jgi:predicted glycogen debranching enzyme
MIALLDNVALRASITPAMDYFNAFDLPGRIFSIHTAYQFSNGHKLPDGVFPALARYYRCEAVHLQIVMSDNLPPLSGLRFGRDVCADLPSAEGREWLVTNGIGGFACGTLAGTLTRRYHGLLVAALNPPAHRTLLVSKLDESVEYDGKTYALGANRWADGVIDPQGHLQIESFRLEGTTPVWTFAFADALLEKRIWMEHGANTTYVRYDVVRSSRPVNLAWRVLVNYRDFHTLTHSGDWRMEIQPVDCGLRVRAFEGAAPFYLLSARATVEPTHVWFLDYWLSAETARGLPDLEDHLHAGTFRAKLASGESVTFAASLDPAVKLLGNLALHSRAAHEHELLDRFAQAHSTPAEPPAWIRQMVLAADQFIVRRPLPGNPESYSVIAGYPWFGDWGRDTMIAVPGLLLSTGRPEIAAAVLRTYAPMIDRGMLPNHVPEVGESAEYNTVDAALWFFEAVREYTAATRDLSLARELFPALGEIIDAYTRGTRYNIHVDARDGLLYAGEAGAQLTWMDAKVGNWVVTPRIGKPVEVNALWYSALVTQAQLAADLGRSDAPYMDLAARARRGFQRFWNDSANCCFDVIDGPTGNDAGLRPNQILAVALHASPLELEQQRAVVDICARVLLTSYGLRSLSPGDFQYHAHYGGNAHERDGAYHQGTVWGWLIGPFIQAYRRVMPDPERARSFLAPFEDHLRIHGVGTASEIFDGDPPFAPHGCFAQAWTVAEVLRAWGLTSDHL